jgi:hypothetical protein
MVRARLVWLKGGQGTIESLAGDAIVIRSTISSPPGSRLDSQLVGINGEPGPNLRVKIHNSKKQDDGMFLLDGRALDMTREVRQFIGANSPASTTQVG